jgi:hypothetical protein
MFELPVRRIRRRPLALFGTERYPGVNVPARSSASFGDGGIALSRGGLAFQKGGAEWTLLLLTALAVANVILVVALRMVTRR